VTAIFKIPYRFYRLFSGLWRWAQRRFTGSGLALGGALLVAMGVAIDTDNNVDYQAFALLLALLLVAAASNWPFRAQFSALRQLPRFGTAGTPLRYTVLVRNLTPHPLRGLTLLENIADSRPGFEEWLAAQLDENRQLRSFRFSEPRRLNPFKTATLKDAPVPALPPNQDIEVRIELTPLRRGVLRFTGLTLASPDPLGLCRALVSRPLPQTALILPKRYLLPPIALPGIMKYQQGGIALSSSVGQSDEFVGLRDYRRGDPLRHIHWRSWAKAGKPVVKEFEDEFFVRHALVLDTFSDYRGIEVFEEAVSVAASFACAVQTQESLLDLLFVGPESYCFTAGRGLARSEQMLEILASVCACRDRPFSALEHLVLDHINAVSGCICVLLAWDHDRRQFVEKLKVLGLPLLVLVIVRPGAKQPLDPGPLRDQPDRFHVLEAGRIELGLAALK
jgi:uncharacterized protein (DUF58 family)